jgi:putative membrane-bound dehydrogenase-like protein
VALAENLLEGSEFLARILPTLMKVRTILLSIAVACPLVRAAESEWKPSKPPGQVAPMKFHVPEGLEVTVWGSTPQLFNPTNFDVDAAGRIWVAEGVNYRGHAGRRPEGDRIVVLEDKNGDGKADDSHTFVQEKGLISPLGVAVFDNRVVVSQPPDLIVYTDVNRDLKFDPAVDKREVLLTGFNAINHDHSLHSVVGGPDGKWYINGGNCGALFTDKSGKTFSLGADYKDGGGKWPVDPRPLIGKKSDDGHVWTPGFTARMNPDGSNVEIVGHGYRNSFENTINSFGEVFQNDNDDPPACRTSYVLEYGSAGYFTREGRMFTTVKRPKQEFGRAHWRQDDPGTFDVGDIYGGGSPSGIAFYENGVMGKSFAGTLLSCETARNVVFSYQPQAKGAGYKLERSDFFTTNKTGKFYGSDFMGGDTDKSGGEMTLFRPSDVMVGADGALYVADWYDPRVGAHADLDDTCSGTIYRIAPKGFKPVVPKVDLKTIPGSIVALRSPAVNVRWTGFDALKAQGPKALDAVVKLTQDPNPWVAARGVWLLPHLGPKGLEACEKLLASKDERTRLVAFRALRRTQADILPYANKLKGDSSAAVRRDVALSVRNLPAEKSAPILIAVAKGWDGTDKNYLESIGLGAANQEDGVWTAMRDAFGQTDPLKWTDSFARLTWRLWPSAAVPALQARASAASLSQSQRAFAVESLSFIDDRSAAMALLDLAAEGSPVKDEAKWWTLTRARGAWEKFNLNAELKQRGIYDPDKIVLTDVRVPLKPKSLNFQPEAVLKLKGDATRGKAAAMRCTMCHQINGVGPQYGPDLKGWVARQGPAMAATAIVDPSAEIAHGFEGTAIQLKTNDWIDGLVQSNGDPMIVVSSGGFMQIVPKARVQSTKHMDRSLMLSADQLGLTPQDVADVIEWLKTY